MTAGTGWKKPWQDDNRLNQPIQPLEVPFSCGMIPTAVYDPTPIYDPSAVARSRQDEIKLPPLSNAVHSTSRAPLYPESTTQQSPSQVASVLPPVSRTPAALNVHQRSQLGHRDGQDSSSLRRLSLPPLVYDGGLGEHSNRNMHTEHVATQLPQEQHQQNGLRIQSRRHMSAADLTQVNAFVRGASDWAVGQTPGTIKDEETPTAAETSLYVQDTQGDTLCAVVRAIVLELALLDNNLGSAVSPADRSTKAPDVTELGLQHCLDWALQGIRRISRWCHCQSKRDTTNTGDETPRLFSTISTPASLPATKRKVDGFEEEQDETRKKVCPRVCNDRFEAFDRSCDYTLKSACRKKSYLRDPPPSPLSQCPRQADSSTSPALVSPPSSMHSSSSTRVLPTLSSLSFSSCPDVLPTFSPLAEPSHSAQAAHLQDLQHQISTKTLALQTLQREHDNLLSAFSRSQIRCATLEKKFQVSDTEINTLTEERIRLLSQIEAFDTQVEELTSSREEARKQSVANGGQYMKIMAMASKLEAQGAADKKKWMSERESWDREKQDYCREIQNHQNEKGTRAERAQVTDRGPTASSPSEPLPLGGLGSCSSVPTHPDHLHEGGPQLETNDILKSISLVALRNEIVWLRETCSAMKVALQDIRTEGERMEQAMHTMGSIKQQISTKADAALRTRKYSSSGSSQLGDEGVVREEGKEGEEGQEGTVCDGYTHAERSRSAPRGMAGHTDSP